MTGDLVTLCLDIRSDRSHRVRCGIMMYQTQSGMSKARCVIISQLLPRLPIDVLTPGALSVSKQDSA